VVIATSIVLVATGPAKPYYVSLGDSYSVGFQHDIGSTSGYTAVVAGALGMQLENFGCAGATTSSMLDQIGCSADFVARTDGVPYPTTTQTSAADAFLQAHRSQIGLITLSIGWNTFGPCATAASSVPCTAAALAGLTSHLAVVTSDLRSAVGPGVPIIGIGYPDVILGHWVFPPGQTDPTLARMSVVAAKDDINPALTAAYHAAGDGFVDVTTATGANDPLTETTTLAPYGTIPVAVARVCELTYYCTSGTIHPDMSGYALIGDLVVSSYHAMTAGRGS
jgi:hypothetical protein